MALTSTEEKPVRMVAENRRALMRYTVEERLEVGIALLGSEVKSIRAGKMEISDAHATVRDGQMFLMNAYVAPYRFATIVRHEEKRTRKLLARRHEIDRLDGKVAQRGFTLVPMKVYFRGPFLKIELALCKGKDASDRRQEIKKREGDREARAAIKRSMAR